MSDQARDGSKATWWDGQGDDAGQAMVHCAQLVESSSHEGDRNDYNLVHARMFENAPVPTLYNFGGAATHAGSFLFDFRDRATWNVMRSAIMTAASQITRNRPRARFITTGGNWKQKRKAKKLTQFCDGLASETKMYELTRRSWVDSAVFDAGAVQVVKDSQDKRIRLQRVLACEVLIDGNEGLHGEQRTMYRRRPMDRDRLLAKFGGKKDSPAYAAIKNAERIDPLGTGGTGNMVMVYEAWHLAAGKGMPGRHIIAVKGAGGTLFEEDWDKDYFPIVFLRWEDAVSGPWGRSLAEQLAPIQYEIDKLLVRIEKSIRLMCVPRIGVPRGAKISTISNGEGTKIEFSGAQPPTALNWSALPAEVYQQLERHVQAMYDLAGISRNAAQGQKETGVTSGEAIRESIDIQQARMATAEQRWEQFHVDLFRIAVDFARDLYNERGAFKVKVPGEKFLETIDWGDVNLESDEYVLDVFPTSYLPITPQGRLSTVQDLVTSGIWTADRAAQALDDLDVDREMSVDQAAEHYLEKQMEQMLYDGKAQHPDETTDLVKAVKSCAQYINLGLFEDAPPKHLDLVRRYLEEVRDLMKAAMPPPPPPVMAGPPGAAPVLGQPEVPPPGMPMAPPAPAGPPMPMQ